MANLTVETLAALIRARSDEYYEHAYDMNDAYCGNTLTFDDMRDLAAWLLPQLGAGAPPNDGREGEVPSKGGGRVGLLSESPE